MTIELRTALDPAQPLGPVLRYLGFALGVAPACGVVLWYAIAVGLSPPQSALVPVAVPLACICLAVIAFAGRSRSYPPWLIAVALLGAVATAVPWLFVIGFGAIAAMCPTFGKLCLG